MVSPRISHPILSRLAHVQKNDDLRTSSWSFCSFILALFNFSLETSAVVGPEFTGNPCGEKNLGQQTPKKLRIVYGSYHRNMLFSHGALMGLYMACVVRQRKPLFLASNIKWTMQKRQFSGLMKSLKLEWTVEPPKNGKGMERRGSLSIHATGWSCKATVSDGFSPNLFGHACVFSAGKPCSLNNSRTREARMDLPTPPGGIKGAEHCIAGPLDWDSMWPWWRDPGHFHGPWCFFSMEMGY